MKCQQNLATGHRPGNHLIADCDCHYYVRRDPTSGNLTWFCRFRCRLHDHEVTSPNRASNAARSCSSMSTACR